MGTSPNFGSKRQPSGKEFRDSGSLGEAVKDLYKDIDEAFVANGKGYGALPTTDVYTADAGAVSTALTAANFLKPVWVVTPGGADSATFPNANTADMTTLLTALKAAYTANGDTLAVDDTQDLIIISAGGQDLPIVSGSGGSDVGNMTIAANGTGKFRIRWTSITAAAETFTIYRIG
jgi:hypothetical protein